MIVYYATTNGEHSGNAGNYHMSKDNAQIEANQKNAKATEMELKVRYSIGSIESDTLPKTNMKIVA